MKRTGIQPRNRWTNDEIVGRWDDNAPQRFKELNINNDPSYRSLTHLVCARIRQHSTHGKTLRILDAGCGVGFLARSLADLGHDVVAIDPSVVSIDFAKQVPKPLRGSVNYIPSSIEDYTNVDHYKEFDVVVANMTLHCVPKLQTFMEMTTKVLAPEGFLLVTIPNPDSYLQSRSDIDVRSIDLRQNQAIEIAFRIHGHKPHPSKVIFYHRPYKTYIECAKAVGLPISDFHVPQQVGIGRPNDIALMEFSQDR